MQGSIYSIYSPLIIFLSENWSRILGIIVHLEERETTPLGQNQGITNVSPQKSILVILDDSTGILMVYISGHLLTEKGTVLHCGDLLDCAGEIHQSITDSSRFFVCSGYLLNKLTFYLFSTKFNFKSFDVKEDPMYELLRYLEIVTLYKDLYFKDTKIEIPSILSINASYSTSTSSSSFLDLNSPKKSNPFNPQYNLSLDQRILKLIQTHSEGISFDEICTQLKNQNQNFTLSQINEIIAQVFFFSHLFIHSLFLN